jgi:ABC-type transport system involved in multi-copper enzyme maturation permease subunit
MNWLLWKDYRHNRLIVFTTLLLLVLPYLVGIAIVCLRPWLCTVGAGGQIIYWTPPWREIIAGAGIYSLAISQLSMALLGSNAISGERVDRSSQFLYSLPVTRRKLLVSKLLFASVVTAVIWSVNIAVFLFLFSVTPVPQGVELDVENVLIAAACVATTGLTFFCVAWFLSSVVASPAFDVCGGLIAPVLVGSGLAVANGVFMRLRDDVMWHCYLMTCLILALVSFAAGTWHYLRRIEP